jgi:acyl transferase domain-containing protein
MMVLRENAVAGVVNCRTLNPHISAALGDWRGRCGLEAAVARGAGAKPCQASLREAADSLAGSSSFGMSGVNAHVLLGLEDSQTLQLEPRYCTVGLKGQCLQ